MAKYRVLIHFQDYEYVEAESEEEAKEKVMDATEDRFPIEKREFEFYPELLENE